MLIYAENMEGKGRKSWEKVCAGCAFSYAHTADPTNTTSEGKVARNQKRRSSH